MARTYSNDASGKQRFVGDMLGVVSAELGLAGRPDLTARLTLDLQLSADQVVNLGEAMRRFLLMTGETPQNIAPLEYLQAQTLMDLLGILWLSLNGSQTWP
jgi:hypothetical protein